MNQIEQLVQRLASEIPEATHTLEGPAHKSGNWWLDSDLNGHSVTVEWRPGKGFGISASPSKAFGEGPDEVFTDLKAAGDRVINLLRGREYTQPPAEMLLSGLRDIRRMSQDDLAKRLNVSQATISKMERRSNMYLKTLRKLIKALGGELEIRAKFPEGVVRINQFGDR
jgi:DNA-binding XRE family transcriptional regulator